MTPPASKSELALRELRRWHLGAADATPVPDGALPLLLAPFRDPERVRHDYPLVLEEGAHELCARPLGDVLAEWCARASNQPRVLHDNLRRLERRVRVALRAAPSVDGSSVDGRALLQAAGDQMVAELALQGEVAAGVRADLAGALDGRPAFELLVLSELTPLRLLKAAASQRVRAARTKLDARVRELAEATRKLLAVEAQKDPEARAGDAMKRSLGGAAARFLDPSALARSVGAHRGGVPADPARRARLARTLATLDGHLAAAAAPELVIVHAGAAPALAGADMQVCADVCDGALHCFEAAAATLLPVVGALFVADLEQRGAYDPGRHDTLLAALGWRDLSTDELHALPVVVAVGSARQLVGHELQALTRLLTSARPVQVLVREAPAQDPLEGELGGGHEVGAGHPGQARLELGYLGIALREAFVQQTTAARPAHLLLGLQRALAGTRPGLHVVDSGLDVDGHEPRLGAFLHAGAAIEGRAHPLFRYDPEAGETWARRLDFTLNPAPEEDWPRSAVRAPSGGGAAPSEIAFTFADFALLEPRLRSAFALVPDDLASDELVELADHLQLPEDEARRSVPFVRISLGESEGEAPRRAAVQRSLVDACRDRLRFWRTLQELAGVRNEHVREAVQRARQEAAAEAAREREALAREHGAELERTRAEAAGEALQGLARMLLELEPLNMTERALPEPRAARTNTAGDATSFASPTASGANANAAANATANATAPASNAPASPPKSAPVPTATSSDAFDDEPWIESARCSTCNDCVNLNSLLFVYDENKQARIGDRRAGTYAQLVQAAEKCPSRCIHPGRPLNPDEPGLEALIARAAPFNQ